MEKIAVTPVNITDEETLGNYLNKLQPDTQPVFGLMTAQHMIEHLTLLLLFSNGNRPIQLQYTSERGEKIKAVVIYTDRELPVGFKSPLLPKDELLPLVHADLQMAIHHLKSELKTFHEYFQQHPDAKPENPTMGALTYNEWIVFHNKHFTHHFKQFALI